MTNTRQSEGERIAVDCCGLSDTETYKLAAAVDAALAERDEHWAKLADAKGEEWGKLAEQMWAKGDESIARIRMGWSSGAFELAAAIRNQGDK